MPTDQNILNQLNAIEAYADKVVGYANGLKKQAAGLRRKLEGVHPPATPKGAKKFLTEIVMMEIIEKRNSKFRNKKTA